MKLREEIVYMSLENKYLYCIPVVYREMLQSLSSIKESISFNYNVIDIYHQPLFCNSEIMSGNCKPPLLFSHIMVLYFTRCAPLFHIKLTQMFLISVIAQSGIDVSDKVAKMFQHADDATVTVSNKQSIDEVFNVLELYGKCSGARINKSKSEIMPIGKGCITESEQQRYGLKICENELLLLGVFIGKNQSQCNELNWRGKINKIKALLNMWLQRKLTIQGRVNVISSLFMSRLWYTLFVTSMPDWAITEIKNICVNFIWNKGAHLVKYNTIICEKSKGGLQLPDIKSKFLQLHCLARSQFLLHNICLLTELCQLL
jgi:hypothetical protein